MAFQCMQDRIHVLIVPFICVSQILFSLFPPPSLGVCMCMCMYALCSTCSCYLTALFLILCLNIAFPPDVFFLALLSPFKAPFQKSFPELLGHQCFLALSLHLIPRNLNDSSNPTVEPSFHLLCEITLGGMACPQSRPLPVPCVMPSLSIPDTE